MISKIELRKELRARRVELARTVPNFAQRIPVFAHDLNIAPDAVVAGYWPVRDEADPRALMNTLECTLALPRIDAKHSALSFRTWREGDVLVDNHHAIAEPREDAPPVTPDVVLVPLLAFDAHGHRLGYGGGYYDRTLHALRATNKIRAIGIAYAGQETQTLPREPHDHPLDAVLTENGLRAFTR